MKIRADREICASSSMCVQVAPDIFALDAEDGQVQLLEAAPQSEQHKVVREAVMHCPSSALSLDDD